MENVEEKVKKKSLWCFQKGPKSKVCSITSKAPPMDAAGLWLINIVAVGSYH